MLPDIAHDLSEFDEDVTKFTPKLTIDRLDSSVFTEDGYYLEISGIMARDSLGGDVEYDKVSLQFSSFESTGNHTFSFAVSAGSSLGTEIPLYDQFAVGGLSTIAGLETDQLLGNYFGYAQLGYRYKIGKLPPSLGENIYMIVRLDAGNTWLDHESIDEDDIITGSLYGLGAETKFGPMLLGAASAEQGEKSFYVALGTQF